MIDFYNNTYYLRPEEVDEAIEILKKHTEYKGLVGRMDIVTVKQIWTTMIAYGNI